MAAAQALEDLKRQKKRVKTLMTQFQNVVTSVKGQSIDQEDLQLEFEEYEEHFADYIKIVINMTKHASEDKETDKLIKDEQAVRVEHRKLRIAVKKLLPASTTPTPVQASTSASTSSPGEAQRTRHTRLPAIEIPKFNGNQLEWQGFHDLFASIIHNNDSISNIEKFHYLKTTVIGDAAFVIQKIMVSDENYAVAWKSMTDHYQNKRAIISLHLDQLFKLPTVQPNDFVSLRCHTNHLTKQLGCLEAINQPTIDCLLIHLSVSKLDKASREKWEEFCISLGTKLPTQEQLITFLSNRCQVLRAREPAETPSEPIHNPDASKKHKSSSNVAVTASCAFCEEQHASSKCELYLGMNHDQRWQLVRNKRLCFACLSTDSHKNCKYKCFKCTKRHHVTLHRQNRSVESPPQYQDSSCSTGNAHTSSNEATSSMQHNNPSSPGDVTNSSTALTATSRNDTVESLLQTVLINMQDKDGRMHIARALLDNGSSPNIMTSKLATLLNASMAPSNTTIYGVGGTPTRARGVTRQTIYSMHTSYHSELEFIVMDQVTAKIPNRLIEKSKLNLPSHLPLADPDFNVPGEIDVILGSGIFWNLTCVGQFQLNCGLIMQKTKLGWILAGMIPWRSDHMQQTYHTLTSAENEDLQKQVQRFWELEAVCDEPPSTSSASELHFRDTVQRDATGRFVLRLPFNGNKERLGENYDQALSRFKSLEHKLLRNNKLKDQYIAFMEEYVALQHMTISDYDTTTGYFLPHHAVFKETSTTTKCRVVFDGSAKSNTGISLNDTLHVGPVVQDDLVSILLRFRKHAVVLIADVEKMYRQVLIHPMDRKHQRILWRSTPADPVTIYELNTVTYGTSCAPFMATRCLNELADIERSNYSIASNVLRRDFYVDDCITGCNSVHSASKLKSCLTELLSRGGFKLQKWRSNVAELMDTCATQSVVLNKSDMNTLGLLWNYFKDNLNYSAPVQVTRKVTKRTILSDTSRLFDPLGLIGPIIVCAKIMLQLLWKDNYDWDESVPMDIYTQWVRYRDELHLINDITIPRCITSYIDYDIIELHGFCDSSERAYGAAIYVRTCDSEGQTCVRLLCSKSRVSPLKTQTLPRLELCGALLLSRLVTKVSASMNITFTARYFWTDSTIVLSWLASIPSQWKTFVANRVSEIQTSTTDGQWRHVRSEMNPADIISRGSTPSELNNNALWWTGPAFLQQPSAEWPTLPATSTVDTSIEQRAVKQVYTVNVIDILFTCSKYSSLTRLRRVVAYSLRFVNAARARQRHDGIPSTQELRTAMNVLLRQDQAVSFAVELNALRKNEQMPRSSSILRLRPFLDDDGLLRVGGRLQNAAIPYDERHPVILPQGTALTELIINFEHLCLLHAGANAVLASIRTKYWPLAGKTTVQRILRQCVRCCRDQPILMQPLMGNLPAARVRPARPFSKCGLDYCGPFHLRFSHRRGTRTTKAYVAVFVCFVTKAVHLELVGDMTAEACLGAIQRMVARRGLIAHMYSDNGSNFIGVNNELKRLAKLFNTDANQQYLASHGIEWHFIPPRSPHFGGLWEAAVKIAKRHLRRVCTNASLTFEEMSTILARVEACLNSRPITPVSNDPADLSALTPGHFLIGGSMTTPPEVDLTDTKINRLSHWQRVQQITQHFWQRWQREYLTQQQQRTKWLTDREPLQLGALVTIRDDLLPPLQWKLGRVVQLHPGTDNVPRVATVKTATGTLKCSITRFCVLPIKPVKVDVQ